jgi:hypothetical protein
MLRGRWPLILTILIVAGLLTAAVLVRHKGDGSHEARPKSTESAATAAEGQDGRPGSSASQAVTSPGGSSASSAPAPENSGTHQDELPVMDDLVAFTAAFYKLEPGDTAESRRARFESAGLAVAPGLFPALNFAISSGDGLGLAPFDGTQRLAATLTGEYQVTDAHGDGNLLYVVAPANMVQTDSSGKEIGRLYVMTATTWSKDEGKWLLTAFADTYQQTGGP